jgi:hypothetical protein
MRLAVDLGLKDQLAFADHTLPRYLNRALIQP